MMDRSREANSSLAHRLESREPAAEWADKLALYAWLVGSWEMDVLLRKEDGTTETRRGTIDAGWVLEGRAIQDVFAVPGLFYGTSLRVYDPNIDAWHVFWVDPLRQSYFRMIGRREGDEIVNEGTETPELARAYGLPEERRATVRWIFSQITPTTFHWRSERTTDGVTWKQQREYAVRRAPTPRP